MGSVRHRRIHPLNRAESNAVICGDPPETLTAGFQRGADRLGLLGGHPGAAEHLPLRPGTIQPGIWVNVGGLIAVMAGCPRIRYARSESANG